MFHLLVRSSGWAESRDSMSGDRIFEYIDKVLSEQFKPAGQLDAARVTKLPALFVSETGGRGDQRTRVGTITCARPSGRDVALEYTYDSAVPPIPNEELERLASELDIELFEFSRTHWSIKDIDLFRVLLRNRLQRRQTPRVFQLADREVVEDALISVMMPFHPSFDAVCATLRRAAEAINMRCLRADDIWDHDAVIQDVVSLIDRSRVVIYDCTERNPNVFYEAGIAHTLGRDVILITQSENDVPFDLRHLRFVQYLNNGEGLCDLYARITPRLQALAP